TDQEIRRSFMHAEGEQFERDRITVSPPYVDRKGQGFGNMINAACSGAHRRVMQRLCGHGTLPPSRRIIEIVAGIDADIIVRLDVVLILITADAGRKVELADGE